MQRNWFPLILFCLLKIKWLFDTEGVNEIFILSVDGVHCKILEPRTDPGTKWYSHKSNGAGLSYELGIALHHNQLCWINGPFPAGKNDMAIFKSDGGLMHKMPRGKRAITDEGYCGEPWMLSTRNPLDLESLKVFKRRAKGRHESFNSRLKVFNILKHEFRGKDSADEDKLSKHQRAFESCCILIQYEMEHGRPLFEVWK